MPVLMGDLFPEVYNVYKIYVRKKFLSVCKYLCLWMKRLAHFGMEIQEEVFVEAVVCLKASEGLS